MTRTILIAFLSICCAVGAARAEKRVALVIGNDTYQSVPALKKAVNDARTIATTLERLGFEVIAAENLARRDMNLKIQDFANRIEAGDVAMVFYAGHGVEIDGQNFLLPTDIPDAGAGQEDFIKQESIGLGDVLGMLRDRKARLNLVILDACRNNPFTNTAGRGIGSTRGLARVDPPRGTFIMYSAGTGEEALDRLDDDDPHPNSVFTRTLVPIMTEPGRSLVSTAREVRREVRKVAATARHSQTPAYYDEVLGDFYFVQAGESPPATTASDRIEGDYRLAADVGTREAWEAFLGRHGQDEDNYYVRLARAALGRTGQQVANLEEEPAPPRIGQCDRLAAHPEDPQKPDVAGVGFLDLQKNADGAIAACREAHERTPANLRFAFQLGRALDAVKRHDEAVRLYRTAADGGYPIAMSNLGYAYRSGNGVARDDQEALRWFREAVRLGDPTGMVNLGWMYHAGQSVARDYGEATRYYRMAAEKGSVAGLYNLGSMTDRGHGTARDPKAAVDLVVRALKSGEIAIAQDLAKSFDSFSQEFRLGLHGVLKEAGAYQGKVDGVNGPHTREAIRRFAGR